MNFDKFLLQKKRMWASKVLLRSYPGKPNTRLVCGSAVVFTFAKFIAPIQNWREDTRELELSVAPYVLPHDEVGTR
jgi:hypothetical protein